MAQILPAFGIKSLKRPSSEFRGKLKPSSFRGPRSLDSYRGVAPDPTSGPTTGPWTHVIVRNVFPFPYFFEARGLHECGFYQKV